MITHDEPKHSDDFDKLQYHVALNYVDVPAAERGTYCGWPCGRSVYERGTKVDADDAE